MRLLWAVLGLYLLAPPPARAQGSGSADSAAIVALELEMTDLLEQGAWDRYAQHLAPDYARTTREGNLESREQALGRWRALGPAPAMKPTRLWVRVYGDAAILTGVVIGSSGGPGTRITKTFIRQHGHWLLAALHTSSAAAP